MMTPALAILTRDLPGHWTEQGEHLIRVRYSRRARQWLATVHNVRMEWSSWRIDHLDPLKKPKVGVGRTVLGNWPTQTAALDAAKDFLAMDGTERIATVRDIQSVRASNRKRDAKIRRIDGEVDQLLGRTDK